MRPSLWGRLWLTSVCACVFGVISIEFLSGYWHCRTLSYYEVSLVPDAQIYIEILFVFEIILHAFATVFLPIYSDSLTLNGHITVISPLVYSCVSLLVQD